jgi:hypothetical protein
MSKRFPPGGVSSSGDVQAAGRKPDRRSRYRGERSLRPERAGRSTFRSAAPRNSPIAETCLRACLAPVCASIRPFAKPAQAFCCSDPRTINRTLTLPAHEQGAKDAFEGISLSEARL